MAASNPGDVLIYEASLGGSFGGVDISKRILNMSVFHDLRKPYSSVSLTLQDVSGLLNGLALDGTQTFSTSFGQPPDQPPYSGSWVLTSIEKVMGTQNQRAEFFTATGFSSHMLNLHRVQKSFRDVPMTDAISSIVSDVLSPLKPFVVRAPSKNVTGNQRMPWTVNGQQVFKALRHLMLGSASAVDQSSAYVMFENSRQLVLDTLENLSRAAGNGPTYYQRQLGADFLGDVARQQFTILAAREESRADSAVTAQDTSQSTRVVDLFSNAFEQLAFGNGSPSAVASLVYNSARPPTFMKDVLAARRRVSGQFDQQALTMTVLLNTALEVGGGVNAQMSAPLGDTNDAVPDRISGPLVVTRLRHTVDLTHRGPGQGPQATTSVRACKGTQDYNA